MGNGRSRAEGGLPGHDPAVVGVAIAGIVSVVVDQDEWDLFDSMVGLVLVLVLLAYGRFRREVVASGWEAAAVGAVWAFSVVIVFGVVIDGFREWFGWPNVAQAGHPLEGFWFGAIWAALTILFAAVLYGAGERLLHPKHRPGAADGGSAARGAREARPGR